MKSKSFRIGSGLVALAMITTCFVGGTLAKYVREGRSADAARAAKWGVQIEPNGNMFSEVYATEDATFAELNSVVSTDKVVAPGTQGELGKVVITGQPEVAVAINFNSDLILDEWFAPNNGDVDDEIVEIGEWVSLGWVKTSDIGTPSTDLQAPVYAVESPNRDGNTNGEEVVCAQEIVWEEPGRKGALFEYKYKWNVISLSVIPAPGMIFYCPIVITVGTQEFNGLNYRSAAEFEMAVERAINAYSSKYAAGIDMTTVDVPEVSWKWAFDGNDSKDTYLGDQAADGNAATITLKLTTTVTQVN
ncbi:hypothetical protein [Floccifex sp.]|uniref:hypothetical protein n=1 Tax=Floccifex sp. TaxID=2815810 RepID=UPI003F0B89AF